MRSHSQNKDYKYYYYLSSSGLSSSRNNYYQYYDRRIRSQKNLNSQTTPIPVYASPRSQYQSQSSTTVSDLGEPISIFHDLKSSPHRQPSVTSLPLVQQTSNISRYSTLSDERIARASVMRERILKDIQENISEIDQELSSISLRPPMSHQILPRLTPLAHIQPTSAQKKTPLTSAENRAWPNKPKKAYQVVPRIASETAKTPQTSTPKVIEAIYIDSFVGQYHYGPEVEEMEIQANDPENSDLKSTYDEISQFNFHETFSVGQFCREQSDISQNRALITVPEYVDNQDVQMNESTEELDENSLGDTNTARPSTASSLHEIAAVGKLNIQDFQSLIQTAPEAKVETVPEPKIEIVPEPKRETIPESKIETVTEPKTETVTEPKTETVSEPKIEAVSEPQIETTFDNASHIHEPPNEIDSNIASTILSKPVKHSRLSIRTVDTLSLASQTLRNPENNATVNPNYFFSDFGNGFEGEEDLISIDPYNFAIPTGSDIIYDDVRSNILIRQSQTSLPNPHASQQVQNNFENNNQYVQEAEKKKIDVTTKESVTAISPSPSKKKHPISTDGGIQTKFERKNSNRSENQRQTSTSRMNAIERYEDNRLNNLSNDLNSHLSRSGRQRMNKNSSKINTPNDGRSRSISKQSQLSQQRSASLHHSSRRQSIDNLSREQSYLSFLDDAETESKRSQNTLDREQQTPIQSRRNSRIPVKRTAPDSNEAPPSTSRSSTPQRRNSIPRIDNNMLFTPADLVDLENLNAENPEVLEPDEPNTDHEESDSDVNHEENNEIDERKSESLSRKIQDEENNHSRPSSSQDQNEPLNITRTLSSQSQDGLLNNIHSLPNRNEDELYISRPATHENQDRIISNTHSLSGQDDDSDIQEKSGSTLNENESELLDESHSLSNSDQNELSKQTHPISAQNQEEIQKQSRPPSNTKEDQPQIYSRPPSIQNQEEMHHQSRPSSKQEHGEGHTNSRPPSTRNQEEMHNQSRPPSSNIKEDQPIIHSRPPSTQNQEEMHRQSRPPSNIKENQHVIHSRPPSTQNQEEMRNQSRPPSTQNQEEMHKQSRPPSNIKEDQPIIHSRPPSTQNQEEINNRSRPPSNTKEDQHVIHSRPPSTQNQDEIQQQSRPSSKQEHGEGHTNSRPPSTQNPEEMHRQSRPPSNIKEDQPIIHSRPPSTQNQEEMHRESRPSSNQTQEEPLDSNRLSSSRNQNEGLSHSRSPSNHAHETVSVKSHSPPSLTREAPLDNTHSISSRNQSEILTHSRRSSNQNHEQVSIKHHTPSDVNQNELLKHSHPESNQDQLLTHNLMHGHLPLHQNQDESVRPSRPQSSIHENEGNRLASVSPLTMETKKTEDDDSRLPSFSPRHSDVSDTKLTSVGREDTFRQLVSPDYTNNQVEKSSPLISQPKLSLDDALVNEDNHSSSPVFLTEEPIITASQRRSKLSLLVRGPRFQQDNLTYDESGQIHTQDASSRNNTRQSKQPHFVSYSNRNSYFPMKENNSLKNWRERINAVLTKNHSSTEKYAHVKSRVDTFSNFEHQPRRLWIPPKRKPRKKVLSKRRIDGKENKSKSTTDENAKEIVVIQEPSPEILGRLRLLPNGRAKIFSEKLKWNSKSKIRSISLENLTRKPYQSQVKIFNEKPRWHSESRVAEIIKSSPRRLVFTQSFPLKPISDNDEVHVRDEESQMETKIFDINSHVQPLSADPQQNSSEDIPFDIKRNPKLIFHKRLAWRKKSKLKDMTWKNIDYQSKQSDIKIFHQAIHWTSESKLKITHSLKLNNHDKIKFSSEIDIPRLTENKALFAQHYDPKWNDIVPDNLETTTFNDGRLLKQPKLKGYVTEDFNDELQNEIKVEVI